MEIVYKTLGELTPYENNPRNNDEAVQYVKNSIEKFGFKVPIVIDKDGVIVAGHTRYKASMELDLAQVPCIVADDLTDEEIRAFRLADNKTAEAATWNMGMLDEELATIGFDMSQFGFDDNEFGFDEDFGDADNLGKGSLQDRFLVPPFSVIYGNRGDWLSRKRNWINFGIHSEIGRGDDLAFTSQDSLTSIMGKKNVKKNDEEG